MSAIANVFDFAKSLGCKDSAHKSSLQSKSNASASSTCAVLFMTTMAVIQKLGGGTMSQIFATSAGVQLLGFVLLHFKVQHQETVAGLSSRTLQMYVLFFVFRLGSTLFQQGYMPVDATGCYVYQAADVCSLAIVLNLLYSIHKRYPSTYQSEYDTLAIYKTIPAILTFAAFLHGDLNANKFGRIFDKMWMASLLFDTIALVPQVWMSCRLGGKVESWTSHFVASLVMSRCLATYFWWAAYEGCGPRNGGPNICGHIIISAHVVQLLLCADFMYYYVKGLAGTNGVVLPASVDS